MTQKCFEVKIKLGCGHRTFKSNSHGYQDMNEFLKCYVVAPSAAECASRIGDAAESITELGPAVCVFPEYPNNGGEDEA